MLRIWKFWLTAFGTETWTLRKVDQNNLESFKIWCWKSTEKTSWTDHVRKETALHREKEERNVVRETKWREGNWTGHTCLVKHTGKIDGWIRVTDDEEDVNSYWMTLKKWENTKNWEEALNDNLWRNGFGRSYGPVARQTTNWTKECMNAWMNERDVMFDFVW